MSGIKNKTMMELWESGDISTRDLFREIERLRAEVEAYQEDAERLMNLVRRYGSSMTNSQIREHLAAMGASA